MKERGTVLERVLEERREQRGDISCRNKNCGQAKIEAGSQALVVPTELTRSVIICVFCISEMDKVDNKSSFMQLKSI